METIEMSEEDVEELRTAFMYNQYDTECYLDIEEGRVVWFSGDALAVDGEPDESDPEWVREAYAKRMAVWNDEEGRYLEVPPSDITDACEDMAAYLEGWDGRLARKFEGSDLHSRSFEAFKREVERDPEHRQRWRKFREERVEERVREWLELQGYDLVIE